MSQNLVNIETGDLAEVLNRNPNGHRSSARATFNSLSNAVSACAQSPKRCRALLDTSNAGSGPDPASSWQSLAGTARYPSYRAARLFRIQKRTQTFTPALASAPKAWTLALKFVGNHKQFDGPGNVAIDAEGNVWANNNYTKSKDPTKICGSKNLFKLYPYKDGAPVDTYSGGGLDGAGFGIGIDPKGHVWVANFQGQRISHFCGSQPSKCPKGKKTGDGISPRNAGYGFDGLQRNTGMGIGSSGNLWLTNNRKNKPVQINPGGNGLVVFIGLASPVKTPSIGVPVKP